MGETQSGKPIKQGLSTGILVLGMHRSGTSAVSGALEKLGIALGQRLLAPGQDNPKGYFEHEGVVNIHSELFHELGSWWYDPRPLPPGWMHSLVARRAEEYLASLVREEFAQQSLWAVKDPRMCRFLPLWRKILDRMELNYSGLMVVRDPSAVAASLAVRNGFRASLGMLLWLRHVMDTLLNSQGMARTVVLYDELLVDPVAVIVKALGRLDISLPAELEQGYEALTSFIEPGLRHHSSSDTDGNSSLSILTQEVYRELCAWSHGEEPGSRLNELRIEYDQIWEEVGPYVDAMADATFPELEKVRTQSTELYALKSKLTAQERWAEETVAQHREMLNQRDRLLAEVTHQRDQLEITLSQVRTELNSQIHGREESFNQMKAIIIDTRNQMHMQRGAVKTYFTQLTQMMDQTKSVIELLRDELQQRKDKDNTISQAIRALRNFLFNWRRGG